MRVAFILPGLHRVNRGAEVAFESIAYELSKINNVDVTLFGSGQARTGDPYKFEHISNITRDHFEDFPKFPVLRNYYAYEEFTFIAGLIRKYNAEDFDITVSCTYPFTNWFLKTFRGKQSPANIFVTQNGDNPPNGNHLEFRYFSCDGLVCTNPDYFERNKDKWNSTLIPNGVNLNKFAPGSSSRAEFDLPENAPLVLIVSALIPYKRVLDGIRAVSKLEGFHLAICGDGPDREQVKALGEELMPGRLHLMKLPSDQMPDLYRTADVLLHMSLYEPFGNVYIEALATGLPVVAHKNQVTQWICEEVAILINTEDESEVIASLRSVSSLDNKAIQRREQAESRFSWPIVAQQYLSFFERVLFTKAIES